MCVLATGSQAQQSAAKGCVCLSVGVCMEFRFECFEKLLVEVS